MKACFDKMLDLFIAKLWNRENKKSHSTSTFKFTTWLCGATTWLL